MLSSVVVPQLEKNFFSPGRTDVTFYFQSWWRRSINSSIEAAVLVACASAARKVSGLIPRPCKLFATFFSSLS